MNPRVRAGAPVIVDIYLPYKGGRYPRSFGLPGLGLGLHRLRVDKPGFRSFGDGLDTVIDMKTI
jgi:hypothetical protein